MDSIKILQERVAELAEGGRSARKLVLALQSQKAELKARVEALEGELRHGKGLVRGARVSGWKQPPILKAWSMTDQRGEGESDA